MPKVDVPYDPTGIAQIREVYARSLSALGRHRDAAEQFLEAAQLIAGDPDNASAHAMVAASPVRRRLGLTGGPKRRGAGLLRIRA